MSLSSGTPDAGIGAAYGVTLPGGDGNLTGFAWSSNYGWIDFNPQEHCTTGIPDTTKQQYKAASCNNPDGNATTGVSRVGDNLKGWARVVSIAEASAIGNSGGWEGWIQMDTAVAGYGVKVNPVTNKLTGYAWNGEEIKNGSIEGLGAFAFEIKAKVTPMITFAASPSVIDIVATPDWKTKTDLVKLTWRVDDATQCSESWSEDGVTYQSTGKFSETVVSPSPNVDNITNLDQSAPNVFYKVECTNSMGTTTEIRNIFTACFDYTCGSQVCNASSVATTNPDVCIKKECTQDNQCKGRQTGTWREVAP